MKHFSHLMSHAIKCITVISGDWNERLAMSGEVIWSGGSRHVPASTCSEPCQPSQIKQVREVRTTRWYVSVGMTPSHALTFPILPSINNIQLLWFEYTQTLARELPIEPNVLTKTSWQCFDASILNAVATFYSSIVFRRVCIPVLMLVLLCPDRGKLVGCTVRLEVCDVVLLYNLLPRPFQRLS